MFEYLAKRKKMRFFLLMAAVVALVYGAGRLYYQVTDGFVESNIAYDHPNDPRWQIAAPSAETKKIIDGALNQPYHYLGKGCQSYVFASEDGRYVIKFLKYQRFRPQQWIKLFSFIPSVENYRLGKIAKKKEKLEGVFTSWMIAYQDLQPETGVVYIHLNKNDEFENELVVQDKIGLTHSLNLNQTEFLLQRRAEMLCPTISSLMEKNDQKAAELILVKLLDMLVSENKRGFADNDHALMQNTGVLDGNPVHVDVGQFVRNSIVKDPKVYNQEIFTKTYRFRKWLEKNYPPLGEFLKQRLEELIGPEFKEMKPVFYTADMARIPNA